MTVDFKAVEKIKNESNARLVLFHYSFFFRLPAIFDDWNGIIRVLKTEKKGFYSLLTWCKDMRIPFCVKVTLLKKVSKNVHT